VHFEQPAQTATLIDYVHQVEHAVARIHRLEQAIDAAVATAPRQMRAVIGALQALRGVAQVSAVTMVAELAEISRFARARQLMGYTLERSHASTPAGRASAVGRSARPVTLICGVS
jgi:transposase